MCLLYSCPLKRDRRAFIRLPEDFVAVEPLLTCALAVGNLPQSADITVAFACFALRFRGQWSLHVPHWPCIIAK